MEWEDRTVLVTGAGGFIGSHLTDKLVQAGAEVTCMVQSGSDPVEMEEESREKAEVVRGDLRDKRSVFDFIGRLEGGSGAVVFHLGAQSNVGESWKRPYETVDTNIRGTLHLLEAIRKKEPDLHSFCFAGSSEEYGETPEDSLLEEESPLRPRSVYGTSKVAADLLVRNYHYAYGIPGVVSRMFNNYGPRQATTDITAAIITQALSSDEIRLGDLRPRRDMCFVSDGVRAMLDIAREGRPGEVYTHGYGDCISMQDWAEKILEIGRDEGFWGGKEIVRDEERFRPGESEVEELCADYSHLHELTGWEPQVSWDEGILKTIRWYAERAR